MGESWGGPQQSESRRLPAGQEMRFVNGGVGERAGCCELKSALRGSHSGECAYGNAGWFLGLPFSFTASPSERAGSNELWALGRGGALAVHWLRGQCPRLQALQIIRAHSWLMIYFWYEE